MNMKYFRPFLFIFFLLKVYCWDMLFQPPSSQNTPSKAAPKDSDVGLDMMQIVEKRGYSIQSFYATTEDGYILNMFRMEKGESKDLLSLETVQEKINHITSRTSCAKPPVLLQHGLLDSSFTWVSNFPYQSLGYILVDAGYDVWFGNNRGNTYSRNHTTKNPDDGTNDFWAFTWDELALIDVPTMINFVLDNTGCPSINWIGHSEGTIQLFGAGSAINEYPNLKAALDKINLHVALAPVAYVNHFKSPELIVMAKLGVAKELLDAGHYEFLGHESDVSEVAPIITRLVPKISDDFLMTICGPTKHINETRLQVYTSQAPAGTSTQNMDHWAQGYIQPYFQHYDYGSVALNMDHYGTATPPLYNLSNYNIPTAIFRGGNDFLADAEDIERLFAEVSSEYIVHDMLIDDYAHLDFVWAYDAYQLLYPEVLQVLEQFGKQRNGKQL